VKPKHSRPLVTVVIAAHDAAPYIDDALASLSGQTLDDLEVVVVDDGSTDGTSDRVGLAADRDDRIRLVRMDRNRGQAAALNAGIELARGRYLATLDADDEARPGRLAEQVAAFEEDRGLALVGGAASTFRDGLAGQEAVWQYACDDESIRVKNLFKSEFISGAMTYDLEWLRLRRLKFDERIRLGCDWDLSSRVMRMGRVANLPQVVLRYRLHPGQMTSGMMDDVHTDSARIRVETLAWMGLRPTEAELRTHLAVSPCNYWAFGAHPYFQAHRGTIAQDAAGWFHRLERAASRTGRVPAAALTAYLEQITSLIADRLTGGPEDPTETPAERPRHLADALCR
jgi:glycosyltransferase involved in cell wall biosynthesis